MKRFLFLPVIVAAFVLASSGGAARAAGSSASCDIPGVNTVPVGGSVVFTASGLSGKNFLGVSESHDGSFSGVMQQVIPLSGSSPTVTVTLPNGPEMYVLVVYNGNGTYSNNHFECWAFANTY